MRSFWIPQHNIPSANDAFLSPLRIERLTEPFDCLIDSVNVGVGDLERLRVAVDGTDGIFHYVSTGL